MSYKYKYPRAALTVDCVVFGFDDEDLKVLLIQRKSPPFAQCWALPGGFVEIDESLDDAARRELGEETGVRNIYLEQLCAVGELDRDPRERVITIAYYALIKLSHHKIQAATDAQDVHWFPISKLPKLAFDHASIFQMAIDRLKQKVRHQPIGFELLPNKFKLSQLQHLYEAILERTIDKRNFRRKILAMGILEELSEVEEGVPHRAAKLYRFDKRRYKEQLQQGFLFEV